MQRYAGIILLGRYPRPRFWRSSRNSWTAPPRPKTMPLRLPHCSGPAPASRQANVATKSVGSIDIEAGHVLRRVGPLDIEPDRVGRSSAQNRTAERVNEFLESPGSLPIHFEMSFQHAGAGLGMNGVAMKPGAGDHPGTGGSAAASRRRRNLRDAEPQAFGDLRCFAA